MAIFSKLYIAVIAWAKHRYASAWLALVSFTESSFFIIPPDIMLAPMALAKPEKAWFYATLTTVSSVLGGVLGYLIGLYALQSIMPLIQDWGYNDAYQQAQNWFQQWGFWAIFMAGFTPIPYKVFTIAAGAASMALWPFIIGSIIGRGLRFFLVAGLIVWGGKTLEQKLFRYIDKIGWLLIFTGVAVYFIWFY